MNKEISDSQATLQRFVVSDGRGGEVAIVLAPTWDVARRIADQHAHAIGVPASTLRVHPATSIRRGSVELAEMGAA